MTNRMLVSATMMKTNACIWERSTTENNHFNERIYAAEVVSQHKMFICGNDALFSIFLKLDEEVKGSAN